jgi:hypothetical protein
MRFDEPLVHAAAKQVVVGSSPPFLAESVHAGGARCHTCGWPTATSVAQHLPTTKYRLRCARNHRQVVDAELQGKTFVYGKVAAWQTAIIEALLLRLSKEQRGFKFIGSDPSRLRTQAVLGSVCCVGARTDIRRQPRVRSPRTSERRARPRTRRTGTETLMVSQNIVSSLRRSYASRLCTG